MGNEEVVSNKEVVDDKVVVGIKEAMDNEEMDTGISTTPLCQENNMWQRGTVLQMCVPDRM